MDFDDLKKIISDSPRIVFFGGAGTSTESNIPDFRSADGLYQSQHTFTHPPEVMLSHSFFQKHPEEFYRFYKTRMIYPNAKPNPAHLALAELERRSQLTTVITQNIDGLHQQAGSQKVLELHGSVHRNYCTQCHKFFSLEYVLGSKQEIPYCDACHGTIKPDVVLYEEMLDGEVLAAAIRHIAEADVLIVGGTSLTVYPAAGLIRHYTGDKLILINRDATPYDRYANFVISDRVGKVLDTLVLP